MMTQLRQRMLEELQGRKSLRLCLAWLEIRWIDPIVPAENSIWSCKVLPGPCNNVSFFADWAVKKWPPQGAVAKQGVVRVGCAA